MNRFRSIIVSAKKKTPYFFSGVRCVGQIKAAIFLSMSPGMLFDQLQITGRRHPVLRKGGSSRLLSFVMRTLRGHTPFCHRTGCVCYTSGLRSHDRVRASIRRLHGLLGLRVTDWVLEGLVFYFNCPFFLLCPLFDQPVLLSYDHYRILYLSIYCGVGGAVERL